MVSFLSREFSSERSSPKLFHIHLPGVFSTIIMISKYFTVAQSHSKSNLLPIANLIFLGFF